MSGVSSQVGQGVLFYLDAVGSKGREDRAVLLGGAVPASTAVGNTILFFINDLLNRD
jgi:hypothetical protein